MIKYKEYDKKEQFNAEINEKIQEVLRLCETHEIPIFISCVVSNSNAETEYKDFMYGDDKDLIAFHRNRFRYYRDITKGYTTTPPIQAIEVNLPFLNTAQPEESNNQQQ